MTLNEGLWYRYEGVLTIGRDRGLKKACEQDMSLDEVLFLAGPTLSGGGSVLGSCGPTSVSRMLSILPNLKELGVKLIIAKGMSGEVLKAFRNAQVAYGVAVGGAGAFYGSKITKLLDRKYGDLGPEGLFKVEVRSFPFYVVVGGVLSGGSFEQVRG